VKPNRDSPEPETDWQAWAQDLCSLLDEIEASDGEERETLIRYRFQIARNHGMIVEIVGAGEIGHA